MGSLLDIVMPSDGIAKGAAESAEALQRLNRQAEQTQARINTTNNTLEIAKKQHQLLAKELAALASSEKATEIQVDRKRLALERSAAAVAATDARLQSLKSALVATNTEIDRVASSSDGLGESLDNVGKRAEQGGSLLKNALSFAVGQASLDAAYALGEAIIGVASGGVRLNSTLEDTQAKLNAFTKDGNLSAQILEQIRDEASATPFAFQELADATANLIPSAKAASAELFDLVKMAEVLAASNPAEGLTGAAFALKEAVSGDFTSAIERFNLSRTYINKLKDEGVPALEIIGRAMQQMGYDTDLVANLAETASGQWSTFKDELANVQATIGESTFDKLKAELSATLGVLEENGDEIAAWAKELGVSLGVSVQAGIDLAHKVPWEGIAASVLKVADAAGWIATKTEDAITTGLKWKAINDGIQAAVGSLIDQGKYFEAAQLQFEAGLPGWGKSLELIKQNEGATQALNAAFNQTVGAYNLIDEAALQSGGSLYDSSHAAEDFSTQLASLHAQAQALNKTGLEPMLTEEQVKKQLQFLADLAGESDRLSEASERLGERRKKAEEDYQAKAQDLARQRTKVETDTAKQVEKINQDLASRLADLNESHTAKVSEMAEQEVELRADAARQIEKLNADAASRIAQLNQEHQKKLAEIAAQEVEAQAEKVAAIAEAEEEARIDQAETDAELAESRRNLAQERVQAEQEFAREVASINQELATQIAEIESNLQEKLQEIGRQRAQAAREHARTVREIEEDRVEAVAEAEERLAERQREIQQDIADLQRSYAESIEERADQLERRLDGLARSYEKKSKDLQSDIQEILDEAQEVAPAKFEYDEASQTFKQVQYSAEELYGFLDEKGRARVDELRARLAEERAAYEEEVEEEKRRAAEAEERERAAYERKLAALQESLAAAAQEREKAQAEAERAAQEALDRERQRHKEEVVSLKEAMQEALDERTKAADDAKAKAVEATENAKAKLAEEVAATATAMQAAAEEHAKATLAIQGERDKQVAAAEAAYQKTVETARQKNQEEIEAHAAKVQQVQAKQAEELQGVQQKNAEALADLHKRMEQEAASLAKAETEARERNQRELADLQAKNQAALFEIDSRLAKEEAAYTKSMQTIAAEVAEVESQMADLAQKLVDGPQAEMDKLISQMEADMTSAGQGFSGTFWQGVNSEWDSFQGDFFAKLQQLKDQLPGSEPKDKSSPLYGLTEAGRGLVTTIQAGIDSAGPLRAPALDWSGTDQPDTINTSRSGRSWRNQPDTEGTGTRGGGSWRSNPEGQRTTAATTQSQQAQAKQAQQTAKAVQAYTTAVTTGASDTKKATQQLQTAIQSTVASITSLGSASSRAASQADGLPRVHSASQRLYDNPPPGGWNSGGGIIESDDGSYGRIGNYFIRPKGSNLGGGEALFRVPRGQEHLGGIGSMTREQLEAFRGTAASYGLLDAVEQRLAELGYGTPPPPTTGGVGGASPAPALAAPAGPSRQITINQTIITDNPDTVQRANRQSIALAEMGT
jgi:hypothetical protein